MLHLWINHGSGVTKYHLRMISGGEGIRFINHKPALLPHQWPPGTCRSTTSSPPTLECCHSGSGVLIQFKCPSLYTLWMKIINDSSHRHLYMRNLAIGISYGQWDMSTCVWYNTGLLHSTMRKMVWKTTVRWIPISLEIHIRKMLLVRRDWRIGRILLAQRMFRPTGYQSKRIRGRRDGSNSSRAMHT